MCLFVSCGSSFSEKDPVFFITSAQHAQPTGSESSDLAIWQSDRESVRREEDHHDFGRLCGSPSVAGNPRLRGYRIKPTHNQQPTPEASELCAEYAVSSDGEERENSGRG